MLNYGFINGRLVDDVKVGKDGKYGFMTLAVQREYKNKEGQYDTDFISVFIPGEKLCANYAKFYKKGDGVIVPFKIRTKVTSEDGNKKTEVTVVAEDIVFGTAGKKYRGNTTDAAETPAATGKVTSKADETPMPDDDIEIPDEDELPF